MKQKIDKVDIFSNCCLVIGIGIFLFAMYFPVVHFFFGSESHKKYLQGDTYYVVTYHNCPVCSDVTFKGYPVVEVDGELYYKTRGFGSWDLHLIEEDVVVK